MLVLQESQLPTEKEKKVVGLTGVVGKYERALEFYANRANWAEHVLGNGEKYCLIKDKGYSVAEEVFILNRVAKGSRIERRCYDALLAEGYKKERLWKTIRHKFLNIDLFGLFDVVCANEQHVRFIQVKTGYCDGETRERIRNCKLPSSCIKEIWEWLDGKKFRGWRKTVIK